jgi:hypothetical protein
MHHQNLPLAVSYNESLTAQRINKACFGIILSAHGQKHLTAYLISFIKAHLTKRYARLAACHFLKEL